MKLKRVLRVLLWTVAALVLAAVTAAVVAYFVMLPTVSEPRDPAPASPPVLGAFEADGPITTAEAWRERRAPALREAFQTHVYGRLPPPLSTRIVARKPIDAPALGPAAQMQQLTIQIGDGPASSRVNVLLMTPKRPGPHPLIVMQSFCGNRAAVPGQPEAVDLLTPPPEPCMSATADRMVRLVFGRHANAPPWEELAQKGYAAASFYAGDIVPDDPAVARAALARLQPATPAAERGGAIAAWAWSYSRVLDVLEREPAIDPARTAVWGHSRNGKAALLAGAMDPRIELVIAHQSGRGGAALNRSDRGESIAQITGSFPHWFGPAYAGFAGREAALPVDQHQLIALIAPRPVLLSAARRDAWSDPASAFQALQGAEPAYRLLGASGMRQDGMAAPSAGGELAAFMRPGRHGVTSGDWREFMAFMDRRFGRTTPPRAVSPPAR